MSDPHHVRSKGAIGQRDECNVVPLCWEHHHEGHRIGWHTFAKRHRVCLPAVALLTYMQVLQIIDTYEGSMDLSF